MEFHNYLNAMVKSGASDLYLLSNTKARLRVQGRVRELGDKSLTGEDIQSLAYSILQPHQIKEFEDELELNVAFYNENIGRFRINIYRQRNDVSLVARRISDIPSFASLSLPEIFKKFIMLEHGLVIVVGATGVGKSTTIAAMLDYRNENSHGHIITIEDPIEFVHPHKNCVFSQREIGIDTRSYEKALQNALRQAPDVVTIGEIRTDKTMEYAMTFAETGHLCISTLHATNTPHALERILNFFPKDKSAHVKLDLAMNLRAIVSQRLVPTVDGSRRAVFEIFVNTLLMRDNIKRGDFSEITALMQRSEAAGMQTFDDHLYQLYEEGAISKETTLQYADSETNVKLKIQMAAGAQETDASLDIIKPKPDKSHHIQKQNLTMAELDKKFMEKKKSKAQQDDKKKK